jgi:hypothetical protein
VSDGERANFLCVKCGACWFHILGWLGRVDPLTCPGCSKEQREVCRTWELVRREREGTRGEHASRDAPSDASGAALDAGDAGPGWGSAGLAAVDR